MRGGGVLPLPILLLLASPAVAKDVPWPSGLYSEVSMHEETGDLLGMEARFFEQDGFHMVEFVWCEGWCNETRTIPVTRGPDEFSFSYVQIFSDGQSETGVKMRFIATLVGKRLRIAAWQGDEKLDGYGAPHLLRRARQPYGISVARSGKE